MFSSRSTLIEREEERTTHNLIPTERSLVNKLNVEHVQFELHCAVNLSRSGSRTVGRVAYWPVQGPELYLPMEVK